MSKPTFTMTSSDDQAVVIREEIRKEVQRRKSWDEMLAALKVIMAHIESGTLVRNTTEDSQPGWALKAITLVNDLNDAKAAIAKAEGK